MEKRHSLQLVLLILIVALAAVGWHLQSQVQVLRGENLNLRENRSAGSCTPVDVSCTCPEYEQGWDDAEYVAGCEPAEIPIEELEAICADLHEYGYAAGC